MSGGVKLGCIFVQLLILYICISNPFGVSERQLVLSTIVGLICSSPIFIVILKRKMQVLPIFEFHMLFLALAFGYSGLCNYQPLKVAYASDDVDVAMFGVLLYVLIACLVYYFPMRIRKRPQRGIEDSVVLSIKRQVFLVYVCVAALVASGRLPGFVIQFALFVETFTFCILVCLVLRRDTTTAWRCLIIAAFSIKAVFVLLGGFFAGLVSMGGAFFCIWLWENRSIVSFKRVFIPSISIASGFALFVMLNPLKTAYRLQTWSPGVSASEKLEVASDLFEENYENMFSKEYFKLGVESVFNRLGYVPIFAGVVSNTPDRIGYKYGETYLSIFWKIIPRVVWTNKPTETLGNEWGREFGFLDYNDYRTSLNLPLVVEGYVNMGISGVFLVALIVGYSFRYAKQWFLGNDNPSLFDVSAYIAILYSLLFPESHFSLTFGGILIGLICLWILRKGFSALFVSGGSRKVL